jgi:hypothetical protein
MSLKSGALAIQRGNASAGLMNVQVVMPTIYTSDAKVSQDVTNTCVSGLDRVTTLAEMVSLAPDLFSLSALQSAPSRTLEEWVLCNQWITAA